MRAILRLPPQLNIARGRGHALHLRVRRRLDRHGLLRRTRPVSEHWGFDRGTPVDRYYIEAFLEARTADIRGRVLEVLDDTYPRRFGHGVNRHDDIDIDRANPRATFVGDLTQPGVLPDGAFDCMVLTQTLQLIYDVDAVVRHAHRILAPGGVLLVTLPALGRVAAQTGDEGDYWRFMPAACRRLFGDVFGWDSVDVRPAGNVLAGIVFLAGMAAEEVTRTRLDDHDPRNPLVITVRAVKHADASA